jgi:rare lipoprotein A
MRRFCKAGPVGRAARTAALVAMASAGLAACATEPRYSITPSARAQSPSRHAERGPQTYGLHGTDKPYQINGIWYYPHAQPDYDQVGVASWYGQQFHNHRTSDGEIFDQYTASAAHKTLPLPCIVEVTNLANGKHMRLRVNDRGPFVDDRLIDLSRAAAEQLGYAGRGTTKVRVRYIGPAAPLAEGVMQASLSVSRRPEPVLEPIRSHLNDPTMPTAQAALDTPPPSPIAPMSPPPSASLAYNVQIGAFATRENAQRVVAQLGDADVGVIEPVQRGGGTLYRVVLGGFSDADTATAAQARVSAAGFNAARVVKP